MADSFELYIGRVFAILAAAVIGSVLGASLALAAVRMEASDEYGDWQTRSRRFKAAAVASVAVLAAISAALALWLAPGWQVGIGLAAFAAAGLGMAVIDVASRRLPFAASSTVALAACIGLAFTPVALWTGLLAGAATAAVMIALSLVSRGGAGGGDVVFAAVAALTLAWAGWMAVVLAVAAGMVLTGLAGLALRLAGRDSDLAPFGPFLLAGWWLALLSSIVDLLGKEEDPLSRLVAGPDRSGARSPICGACRSAVGGSRSRRSRRGRRGLPHLR